MRKKQGNAGRQGGVSCCVRVNLCILTQMYFAPLFGLLQHIWTAAKGYRLANTTRLPLQPPLRLQLHTCV